MLCPHCANQSDLQATFCSSCGALIASQPVVAPPSRIFRPRHPRMIAGVCSGLAIHYGWDIVHVRIVMVVAALLTGAAVFFYIAAWLLLPEAPYTLPAGSPMTTDLSRGTPA